MSGCVAAECKHCIDSLQHVASQACWVDRDQDGTGKDIRELLNGTSCAWKSVMCLVYQQPMRTTGLRSQIADSRQKPRQQRLPVGKIQPERVDHNVDACFPKK